ncbi:MAG TPA: bifunctional nuclease family protein [Fimbriimonadaceae bacterium]|nr:bifunctional nuclease family protein [Fimbriimonadaceae bacterium]
MPEDLPEGEGPDNFDEPPSFFPLDSGAPLREPGNMGELVEVQIDGLYAHDSGGSTSRFVVVTDGDRKLPILIGGFEASAITYPLEGSRPDRPLTHDLIRNILDRLDVRLDRVVIDDLWNGIYYAKLYLRGGKEEMEIDARPSDAIALAVRFDAPIFVADAILDQALDE